MKFKELDTTQSTYIQQVHGVSNLCAKVLASHAFDKQMLDILLAPAKLCNPYTANGMEKVIARIRLAKEKNEKVLVCGDYDADGICATTILYDALKRFGVMCGFYIPNRFKEGYGLHPQTVVMADEKGYSLLITVDNGVKAIEALREAKQRNLDVILTDHHAMDDEELSYFAILHPFLMGEDFETLSGAGVALEIARALIGDVKEHVVLACVASIADVMVLQKETRAIVSYGLQYLKQGICKPIQMLSKDAYPKWDEIMIAFQIVPKLNATGRLADMANANNTVRYLLLQNQDEITAVAKQINDLNEQRKIMSTKMSDTARLLIHKDYRFQMLYDESFHEGMVGLVAGKLSEEFKLPIMVLSKHENMLKGSIRSNNLLDLTTFFDGCLSELSAYGGHKAAAGIGFTVDKKQHVQDYMNQKMRTITLSDEFEYEVIKLAEPEISIQGVESLRRLAPFGEGFKEPHFYLADMDIIEIKKMGDGQHLKFILKNQIEAIYFNCKEPYATWNDRKQISLIGNLRINQFRGKKKVNVFVVEAF